MNKCQNWSSSRASPEGSQKTKDKNLQRNDTLRTYGLSQCLQQEES